jgi:LMBR1-like membrane protein
LYVILRKNGFPMNPFLNKMFVDLEEYNVNFIGVFFFGLFTLYLLFCVTKGNLKCGIQIPYLLKIHPMKVNATWMNSFLFNIALILYSSVAVLDFSITCFSQYSRFTSASMMFRVQLQNSQLLSWAFKYRVFELALFVTPFHYEELEYSGWLRSVRAVLSPAGHTQGPRGQEEGPEGRQDEDGLGRDRTQRVFDS